MKVTRSLRTTFSLSGLGLYLAPCFLVCLCLASAGEMKSERKLSATKPHLLPTLFGTYGYRTRQSIYAEAGGFRFLLPSDVANLPQTGVYSYFALSGDFEVTFAYELQNVPTPRGGYGSGVGAAIEAGDGEGGAAIQRIVNAKGDNGYVLQGGLATNGGKVEEEYRFVPTAAKSGQIALRRVNKELIFLAADSPSAPLQELYRLPFTDRAIRTVRFFADSGGSPSAVDARLRDIELRAEEITAGLPRSEDPRSTAWWLWAGIPAVGGLLYWRWRARRSEQDDDVPTAPRPKLRPTKK